MTPKSNLPQSVKDRLLNLAKHRGEDFNHLLIRYGLERILYRLSQSTYKDEFVLKGATLFIYWYGKTHRPTLDVDLHSRRETKLSEIKRIVREVCQVEVKNDGLTFDLETIQGQEIREGKVYQGVRIKLNAKLGEVKVPIQLDIGFGDSLAPGTEEIKFPTLLDFPNPRLNAYRPVTSIAEKCQFMVEAGIFNSRMKDYYDVWYLSKKSEIEGPLLRRAVENTFQQRKTNIPKTRPSSLGNEFVENSLKQEQWDGFIKRNDLSNEDLSLEKVIEDLQEFILPVFRSIVKDESFEKTWVPDDGWE